MSEKRPIESEEDLVAAFDQLFDEVPAPESLEEAEKYIRGAGLNPDEFGAEISSFVASALANSPLNWRNRNQEPIHRALAALETREKETSADRASLLAQIPALLETLVGRFPDRQPLHYRNLTELATADLASLVQELEFLVSQDHSETNETTP
jgi:hypothetical protein